MLGDIICKLRKEAGYSQEYLGKLLNVSTSSIGMYEQNRRLPSIETLVSMCKIFSVSSDYLLQISYNRSPYEQTQNCNYISIAQRIQLLMAENGMDIPFVLCVTKIQRQRLENILNGIKQPNITEIVTLAECFSVTSDYILCLTDHRDVAKCRTTTEGSFTSRLALLLDSYTELEVANGIDISIAKLRSLLSGNEEPTPTILCKMSSFFGESTDYLLGLNDTSREPDLKGIFPFVVNEVSIQRIQSCLESDDDDYLSSELGLQNDELYMLYHFGFVPHITVINKLCKMFSISADYLLGISDSKLSIITQEGNNEEFLLKSYRSLGNHYRTEVDGFLSSQILQQERDFYQRSSVAADEPLGKTGTDMGK